MSTRREFIKQIGIALASMMTARCQGGSANQPAPSQTSGPQQSPTVPPSPTPSCTPFEAAGDSPRERLRSCWQAFEWLTSPQGGNCCREAEGQLVSAHRAALKELSAAGQLDTATAGEIEAAFGAAIVHTWMSSCRTVCYEPASSLQYSAWSQLTRRIELLDRMAESGELDPDTIAKAQTTIERNMVFLAVNPNGESVRREDGSYLRFEQLDLTITPEAAAAAAFLVELLSGQ